MHKSNINGWLKKIRTGISHIPTYVMQAVESPVQIFLSHQVVLLSFISRFAPIR